jgi:RimJ/RimL family protein N-acetyltransferase
LTTVDQAREVIKNIRQQYVENGIGRWAVFESATGAFIGWAGLKLITEPINGYVNHYDLGYRFMKKYWRKGYASEVAKALVEYGFDILKQNEIHAYTHAGNTASQRVLLKSGFKFIEQFEDDDDDCDWFTITRNSPGNKNQG